MLTNLRVEEYAAEGKSLARVDGKVVFIEKAIPGDVIDLRLTKNKKDWAEGYPILFHSYSADRVAAFCSHFGVCGGCQWQMLPYNKQLAYKQKQVEETLKRLGKIQLPEILPIIGATATEFYRNKLEYTFSTREFTKTAPPFPDLSAREEFITAGSLPDKPVEKTAGLLTNKNPEKRNDNSTTGAAGFHARGWFDKVVEIENCWLQPEPTNLIRNTLAGFARAHQYSFYDYKLHQGFLRNVQVRTSSLGEVMVNVILGEDHPEKIHRMLTHLMEQVPSITTLLYTLNPKWNDSIQDLVPVIFHGKGYILEKLEAYQFRIGPHSFFQTNTLQAEKLYKIAREFAELSGAETVYDLYCGTGSIGIFLSRQAKKIVGVEMIEAAVEDARKNAALNKISQTAFFAGDVTDICTHEFFMTQGKPDVVICDPPRAGLHPKLVNKILDIAAPVVVYVSCNPATQARDLNLLDEKYQVTRVQPIDMFPHTHHIENVVQLKLKN